MVAKALTAAGAILFLAGCATTGGNLCSVGPFIGDADAISRLTRAEKEYVVTLNNSGAEICGWTPPKG